MAPLPKRKYPKARQGARRSHIHMQATHIIECPRCRNPRVAHRACPTCGFYKGREAVPLNQPNLSE
jgi:large subunit ribosomal protein L32